ncbi:rab GTPase-activating protein 1-like [Pseudophryne corroboree]|uniref:rab GTPase-activating protein 1-like n=1 Tax=Pseudophryne corroboree TaxID=495146 RepID=UPI00308176A3
MDDKTSVGKISVSSDSVSTLNSEDFVLVYKQGDEMHSANNGSDDEKTGLKIVGNGSEQQLQKELEDVLMDTPAEDRDQPAEKVEKEHLEDDLDESSNETSSASSSINPSSVGLQKQDLSLPVKPAQQDFDLRPEVPPMRLEAPEAILKLVQSQVIVPEPIPQRGKGYYANLFVVPKPDGSMFKFKMESLRAVIAGLEEQEFMVSLAIKDAFLPYSNLAA